MGFAAALRRVGWGAAGRRAALRGSKKPDVSTARTQSRGLGGAMAAAAATSAALLRFVQAYVGDAVDKAETLADLCDGRILAQILSTSGAGGRGAGWGSPEASFMSR